MRRGSEKRVNVIAEALALQTAASKVGLDWPDIGGVIEKIREELDEMCRALAQGDEAQVHEEVGDVLFSAINLARFVCVDPVEALRQGNQRFSARVSKVKEILGLEGRTPRACTPAELDAVWSRAKRELSGG